MDILVNIIDNNHGYMLVAMFKCLVSMVIYLVSKAICLLPWLHTWLSMLLRNVVIYIGLCTSVILLQCKLPKLRVINILNVCRMIVLSM